MNIYNNIIIIIFSHISFLEIKSRDVVDAISPRTKRLRSSEDFSLTEDSGSRIYFSQPVPQYTHTDEEQNVENRTGFCFSQPTALDNLILCTQLNPTQSASQNVFQKLVRRMTRFFVSTNFDETIKRLSSAFEMMRYTWKTCDTGVVIYLIYFFYFNPAVVFCI